MAYVVLTDTLNDSCVWPQHLNHTPHVVGALVVDRTGSVCARSFRVYVAVNL